MYQKFFRLVFLFLFAVKLESKKVVTSAPHVDDDDDTCVETWKQKNPYLKDRFSDPMMKNHCQKGRKWRTDAVEAIKHPPKPKLTPKQQVYFNTVSKCDLICLCRLWDPCNKFLKGIEGVLGNFSSQVSQLGNDFKNLQDVLVGKNSNNNNNRLKRQTIQQINDVIQDKVGKASRKDIRMLTDDERQTFLRAVNMLKSQMVDKMSKYDILILYHTPEYSPEAHFCAAFFPFHRELLKNIEVALRTVEPTTALPYWDTTLDEGLPDPKDSVLWSDDFLGNGHGAVTSGPFANWTVLPDAQIAALDNSGKIVRGVGESPFGSILKQADIDQILQKDAFRNLVYCVDPFVELIHGATHMFVGGHMLELRTSPNDPSFFMYHCFIDNIWEQWRQLKQDRKTRETIFTNDTESCNAYCYGSATMKPFNIKITGGLANTYMDQLYSYEPRPTCSAANPSCGSPNIFCNTATYRCTSKVKRGGNCTGLESFDSCYKSACIAGRCQAVATTTVRITLPPTTTTVTTTTARPTTAAPGVTTKTTIPTTTTEIIAPVTEMQTAPPVVKTVWIPITVLSMVGQTAQPYPDANIITTDVGHGVKLSGVVADPGQKPYYTGAAYAQMLNPFSVTDNVVASLDVFDVDFNKCASNCLDTNGTYRPCDPKITLSSNPKSNSDVLFTPSYDQAKLLGWANNKRNPDKFLFICKTVVVATTTQAATTTTAPARVQKTTTTSTAAPSTVKSIITVSNQTNNNVNINIVSTSDNSTSHIANGGCLNLHRCCIIWSSVGECKRNPWMQTNCEKDCNVCNGGTDVQGCMDNHPKCSTWSSTGECKKNPTWMEENCKKSCNMCTRPMTDLLVLCGVPKNSNVCEDHNDKCKTWADNKECERNPWWMGKNCPVSCKQCTP